MNDSRTGMSVPRRPAGGPHTSSRRLFDTAGELSVQRYGEPVSGESAAESAATESDEGVIVSDRGGRLTASNAAASRILDVDLLAGMTERDWWAPLQSGDVADDPRMDVGGRAMAGGIDVRDVTVEVDRRGAQRRLSVDYLPLRDDHDAATVVGLVLVFRDAADRDDQHRKLIETLDRLREAHEVARLASWEWDPPTGGVTVFQALAGSALEPDTTVPFERWLETIPPDQHAGVTADFDAFTRGARDESSRRFRCVLPTGAVWLDVRFWAVRESDGRLACVRGTAHDVTEQELAAQDLSATRDFLQATLDSLSAHVAVLDERGEIVLTNRAWTDFAADNGGDPDRSGVGSNYLEACERDRSLASATQTTEALRAILAGERRDYSIEQPCHSPESHRWFAMHATVYEGAGPRRAVVTHDDITERKEAERLTAIDLDKLHWVSRIEDALSNDRFVLHAQPIVDLATGDVVQRELLIRMRHPEGSDAPGLVPPGHFLPIAEEFGLITSIDRWVIDRAAELAATGLPVELNISGRSISDPRLVDHVKAAIERTGADPQMLVFEITETVLVDDDQTARSFVARVHGLGCRVALDDFGTGYGGFTYLKRLPIDFLKIDIEFVRDLLYNPASRTVVEAIVKLARGFGLKTVAEGVESAETMDALRELDVDYVQGYHTGRPTALAPAEQRKAPRR